MEDIPTTTLTFGERAVGLTFNPSGDEYVNSVKVDYSKIIDMLNIIRDEAKKDNNQEKIRLLSVAITEAQTAQMWAVKAITWK